MQKNTYIKFKLVVDTLLNIGVPVLSKRAYEKVYDDAFYADGNIQKCESAKTVARIITEQIVFHSVFDIGCGMGIYLDELHGLGKEVLGCDMSKDGLNLSSKEITIFYADVTKPVILNKKFDLVICFEVAEHIRKRHSNQLVKNCILNGKMVLFTAAPVGQGGVGHINEQPYSYWINIFQAEGYVYNSIKSEQVKKVMKENNVVYWISNNLMLFEENSK